MIKAENNVLSMSGTTDDLFTEATAILTALYDEARKVLGEKTAKELVEGVVRMATEKGAGARYLEEI